MKFFLTLKKASIKLDTMEDDQVKNPSMITFFKEIF
jgi:hypothetical protein